MNENNGNKKVLDWDDTTIEKFAQYLYNLAKEKAKIKESERDVVEEQKPIIETEEIKQEREKTLEEVTIGLAKAVSGEDLDVEINSSERQEIEQIIQEEKIPLPTEELKKLTETKKIEEILTQTEEVAARKQDVELEEEKIEEKVYPPEEKVMREEDLPEVQIAEEINKLEPVDLSQPVVTEPIINEEVLLEPENIPEDVRDLVFVEGAKSVPITKEEIPTISV
ncbi:MAG: hypothetical protein ACTSRO_11220, partial [Candidatus Heimdallarchaeaceae archaeon]